jgi:glutathione S-transferase
MLTLFHYDRTSAAQRVRLCLEEKSIPWESIIVDTALGDIDQLPKNFYELNPKGLVPVIIDDNLAIPESLVIIEYLEERYGGDPKLKPTRPEDLAQMRLWMRKIDEGIHVASRTIGVCLVNRHIYKKKDPGQIKKYYKEMKDKVRKKNDQINIEMGIESPLLEEAMIEFKSLFIEMNEYLGKNTWLAGDKYSLADISFVVYLHRLDSFMMRPLWKDLKNLDQWYEKIKTRPAYKKAIYDWGDVTADQRAQNGKDAYPKIKEYWNKA